MCSREKMNYAPFYVGQKVVAVDAIEGSRIKNGQYYVISDCHYSPSGNPIANGQSFWYVGVMGFDNKWLRPGIFAPIEQKKFPLMTFKEINKVEKIEELINN